MQALGKPLHDDSKIQLVAASGFSWRDIMVTGCFLAEFNVPLEGHGRSREVATANDINV